MTQIGKPIDEFPAEGEFKRIERIERIVTKMEEEVNKILISLNALGYTCTFTQQEDGSVKTTLTAKNGSNGHA